MISLAETYTTPSDLEHLHRRLISESQDDHRMGVNEVDMCALHVEGKKYCLLRARSAKPHVDPDFPEWAVLWVLRSSGHTLGIADHVPRHGGFASRRPIKSPGLSYVPLISGHIVLFNAHRTHWMDAVTDKSTMAAISVDFRIRPGLPDIIESLS